MVGLPIGCGSCEAGPGDPHAFQDAIRNVSNVNVGVDGDLGDRLSSEGPLRQLSTDVRI